MLATATNPYHVRPDTKICTSTRTDDNGVVHVIKTRTVKNVVPCPSKPENVHLDHECYDSRIDIYTPKG